MDRGIETFTHAGKQSLCRADGAVVALTRRGGLFARPCPVFFRPMLLALVDDEERRVPRPPLVDEEMERELMGREEGAPPVTLLVALELRALGEPSNDERRHHGLAHIPHQAWCHVRFRTRGREKRHESRSQVQPGTPTNPAHDHSFGSRRHSVRRDPLASRSLVAIARYVGHS